MKCVIFSVFSYDLVQVNKAAIYLCINASR